MIRAQGVSGKSWADGSPENLCDAAQALTRNAVLAHWNCGRASAMIGAMKISYLWPFRDYRNASTGSALERAAALRHNKTLAKQLPAYLNRWSAISCVLLTASEVCPAALAPAVGVAFTLAFVMTVHIAHVWLLFIRS